MPLPNARLKVSVNSGDAVITLAPGQSLTHHTHESHDEGWSSTTSVWTYDADEGVVVREYGTDGRDCDGRLSTYYRDTCLLSELRTGTVERYTGSVTRHEDGDSWRESVYETLTGWPEWTDEERSQRDHTAESMNY